MNRELDGLSLWTAEYDEGNETLFLVGRQTDDPDQVVRIQLNGTQAWSIATTLITALRDSTFAQVYQGTSGA